MSADAAEDLLADVWKIGRAWTEMAGGYAELHVIMFPGGRYQARWGSRGGHEGMGSCIVDAVLELQAKLEKDVHEWVKEDCDSGDDFAPVLAASLAVGGSR